MDNTPVFSIEKTYVKDLSIEVPNAPSIFLLNETPEIQIGLDTNSTLVQQGIYEVVLTVTVSAKKDDKVFFLVETGQGGVFRIQNIPDDQVAPLLGIACPNILFPFLRETISDAVTRAGFPPVILQPVNFEAAYQSRQQAAAAAQAAAQAAEQPAAEEAPSAQ